MAKLTALQKFQKARAGKRLGAYGHGIRVKSADPGIAIVRLKEGGLGWQVIDEKGAAVKPAFGRVLARTEISEDSPEYQVSSRAIDKTLKALTERKKRNLLALGSKRAGTAAGKARRGLTGGRVLEILEVKASPRDRRGSLEEFD